MNNKLNKKHKKQSKSAEKRNPYKKTQMNPLLYKNIQLPEHPIIKPTQSLAQSPPIHKITDRSKTKSCLGGPRESSKVSTNIFLPIKKTQTFIFAEKKSKNNYQYINVIGKGGFGKVYKVKQKKSGQLFAMKEMSKAVILAKKSNESISNERRLLTELKHKFIVNMRQAFQDRDTLYLIMDLMTGGDLRYHICKKHKFTEEQTRFMAACVFIGLEYMHSQKIIHRDIKPQNLVFDAKGYLHITDLGIAKQFRQENSVDTSGTPGYMAPQVLNKQNHCYEVDYYALGVIVYELMMGKRPYVGKERSAIKEQMMAKQAVIKKKQIPEGWSIQAADFVNKLIQRRPITRLGWGGSEQIRTHAWFRDFPWNKLLAQKLQSPFKHYSKFNAEQVRYQQTKYNQQMSNKIEENKILLRKSTVQYIFYNYTFDENQESNFQNHTTSSQLHRKRQENKTLIKDI